MLQHGPPTCRPPGWPPLCRPLGPRAVLLYIQCNNTAHLSTTRIATTVQATLTAPMMTVLSRAALAPEPVVWNSSAKREEENSSIGRGSEADKVNGRSMGHEPTVWNSAAGDNKDYIMVKWAMHSYRGVQQTGHTVTSSAMHNMLKLSCLQHMCIPVQANHSALRTDYNQKCCM